MDFKLHLTLCFTFVIMHGHPSTMKPFIDQDQLIFPDDDILKNKDRSSSYSTLERKCFNESKVLFQRDCYDLLEKGPCKDGEWLILDMNHAPGIKAKCSKRICDSDSAFWPKEGRCLLIANQTVCHKPGTSLYSDVYGLGSCECKKSKASAMHSTGACYNLYTQGPCKSGQIFIENNKWEPICHRSPCPASSNSTLVWWEPTKKCYEIDTQGPCQEEELFVIDVKSRKPACRPAINNWHLIDLPSGCTTLGGKCIQGVQAGNQGEKYLSELLLASSKRKKNK